MSTDTVKMILTAEDKASAVINGLFANVKRLQNVSMKFSMNPTKGMGSLDSTKAIRDDFTKSQSEVMKGLRQRFTFENRMARQRIAGERAVAAEQDRLATQQEQAQARQERARRIGESSAMADFRKRMAFTDRMVKQQARQDREAERDQAAASRRMIGLDRYRIGVRERSERQQAASERRAQQDEARDRRGQDRQHNQARRDLRSGFSHANDARGRIMDANRTVVIGGGVFGGIIGKIAENGIGSRSRADTAEANLRMFGNQSRNQVNAPRSGWLNGAAIANGFRPADAINAFTETLKAGIPEIAAPDVTKSIMGASAGLDLNVAETTKLVGRLSTLTQDPKSFSAGAIDKMLNGIAVVAKVTAADSKELVSSLRRGAGVLGSSKMSVTDLTAFTGTGISAGMQEGKAGTFMDFMVNELVNAKSSRGQRGQDLTKGFNLLGLGSASTVSRQAANDPTKLLLSMFDRMSKMTPEKAGQVANLIGMREWRGEILQMMKANPMLKQTIEAGRDPKNANHLSQAREEKLGTLAGLRDQLRSTFDLASEAIGLGLEDMVREIGHFFVSAGSKMDFGVIKAHVSILVNGFVDGLGFKNITEMLDSVFGKPDFSTVDSFFRFAQGFGQGVREVIDSVMGALRMFTGKDASAENLGKLGGKIVTLAFGLAFLAPWVGVLGSLGAALIGLAMAAGTIAPILRTMGLLGGAAAGGAAGGTAGAVAGGGLLSRLFGGLKFGLPAIVAGTSGLKKGEQDAIVNRLGKWSQDQERVGKGTAGEPPARVQRQSAGEDWRDLIHRTSYSTTDDVTRSMDRLGDSVRNMGARFQTAALTPPKPETKKAFDSGSRVASSFRSGSFVPGGTRDPVTAKFGKRFFTPPDMAPPNWYGTGGVSGMPGVGARPGAYKPLLDFIAGTEGTAGGKNNGYDVTLANGKLLPGGKEQDLTKMTLDQIDAMQGGMLNHPGNKWNSSASGRYQIVQKTLRGLRRQLGLNGSDLYDEAMQDKLGATLAQRRGANGSLGQEWASLTGTKLAKAVDLAGKVRQSPTEAVTSGLKEMIGGVHPLDGAGRFTSDFGMRKHPLTGMNKLHAGIDLAAPAGTPVKAMRDGVVSIGRSGDVTVKHPDGSSQTYRHVRSGVQEGQKVSAGEIIAQIGAKDARSTGAHLHLESRDEQGRLRDPKKLFGATDRAVASVNATAAAAAKAQRVEIGDGMTSTGWNKAGADGAASGVPQASAAERAIGNVPRGQTGNRGGSAGLGSVAGGGGNTVIQHITGVGENPETLANKVQRHLTEAILNRAHDYEPELT